MINRSQPMTQVPGAKKRLTLIATSSEPNIFQHGFDGNCLNGKSRNGYEYPVDSEDNPSKVTGTDMARSDNEKPRIIFPVLPVAANGRARSNGRAQGYIQQQSGAGYESGPEARVSQMLRAKVMMG